MIWGVEDEVKPLATVPLVFITGFHSLGSRSEVLVVVVFAILGVDWRRVGVIGATIRGERGGEDGGVGIVVGIEGIEAERGLQESLRRQLWVYVSI